MLTCQICRCCICFQDLPCQVVVFVTITFGALEGWSKSTCCRLCTLGQFGVLWVYCTFQTVLQVTLREGHEVRSEVRKLQCTFHQEGCFDERLPYSSCKYTVVSVPVQTVLEDRLVVTHLARCLVERVVDAELFLVQVFCHVLEGCQELEG